jgi:hypothetical protein
MGQQKSTAQAKQDADGEVKSRALDSKLNKNAH